MLFTELGIDPSYIIIGMAAIILILLIMVIAALVKCAGLKKRMEVFFSGKDVKSMETLIGDMVKDVETVKKSNRKVEKTMAEVLKREKDCYSKIGLVHYDAFPGLAGKLSFTMGLLDGRDNGYLINCMHGNNGCYVYMKEIIRGEAMVTLSSEERKALDEALKCEKMD